MRPAAGSCTAALLLLSACGGASDNAERPIADPPVTVVDGGPARIAAQPDLRIDGWEEDLVPVGWYAVDGGGRLALSQPQDYAVRVYDAEGRPIGSVGSQGEGPGEFQRVNRLGWRGDTLWVSDPELDRLVLISPELELAGTIRVGGARPPTDNPDELPGFSALVPWALNPDGSLLALGMAVAEGPAPEDMTIPVLRISEGMIERRIQSKPPADPDEGQVEYRTRPNGLTDSWRVPLRPRTYMEISPSGDRIATVAYARQESADVWRVRVTAVDARADTIFSRDYRFTAPPVTAGAVAGEVAYLEENDLIQNLAENPRELISELRSRMPDALPPIIDLFVGYDGRIWLGLHRDQEGRPWLVLDGDNGQPLGTIVVPDGVRLGAANRMHAWGVERDGVDMPSMVRFQASLDARPDARSGPATR